MRAKTGIPQSTLQFVVVVVEPAVVAALTADVELALVHVLQQLLTPIP